MTIEVAHSITVNIMELVYVSAERSFFSLTGGEGTWVLHPIADKTPPPVEQLRHPRLASARAVSEGIEVTLSDAAPAHLDEFFFDNGPYTTASYDPKKLVLRRKGAGSPATIEVISMSSEDEEWRRFLAREVDIVPAAQAGQVQHLREVPSVRVVNVARPASAALIFNVRAPIFADVGLRRQVAGALRRRALAFAATGGAESALPETENQDMTPFGAGRRIDVVILKAASNLQRAALVLEQQLAEMGFEVHLRALDLEELGAVLAKHEFDALLFMGAYEKRYFRLAMSGDPGNVTGYASADFDKAVADGDDSGAEAVLRRDVPFTPLFTLPEAVAADERLCGIKPEVGSDLSWLAGVHACAPGEHE